MSEKYVNVHEIKANFSRYLKRVQSGKSVVVALRNRPVAELRPLAQTKTKKLVFGALKGRFSVPRDFDDPMGSFEADYYSDD